MDGPRGVRGQWGAHTLQSWVTLSGLPLLLHCCSVFCQHLLGGGVWWKLGSGGRGEKVQLQRVSNFEGPCTEGTW